MLVILLSSLIMHRNHSNVVMRSRATHLITPEEHNCNVSLLVTTLVQAFTSKTIGENNV